MEIKNGTERISFGKKKSQAKEIKKLTTIEFIIYNCVFFEKKNLSNLIFDRNEH